MQYNIFLVDNTEILHTDNNNKRFFKKPKSFVYKI